MSMLTVVNECLVLSTNSKRLKEVKSKETGRSPVPILDLDRSLTNNPGSSESPQGLHVKHQLFHKVTHVLFNFPQNPKMVDESVNMHTQHIVYLQ